MGTRTSWSGSFKRGPRWTSVTSTRGPPCGTRVLKHAPTSVAQLLIHAGADPMLCDGNGTAPLSAAAARGKADTVRYLLSLPNVRINHRSEPRGNTALLRAAERGYPAVVEVLLANGADPTLANVDGHTTLACARARGNEACVKLLEVTFPTRSRLAACFQRMN
jgi:ankyrin repeat protein